MKPSCLKYFLDAMDPPKQVIVPAIFSMEHTEQNNLKIPMLHIEFLAENFGHRRIDEMNEWDGESFQYDVDNLEGEEDFSRHDLGRR